MTTLIAMVVKLLVMIGEWLRDPRRKQQKTEVQVEDELREIANEVEAKSDDRTAAELRDILG